MSGRRSALGSALFGVMFATLSASSAAGQSLGDCNPDLLGRWEARAWQFSDFLARRWTLIISTSPTTGRTTIEIPEENITFQDVDVYSWGINAESTRLDELALQFDAANLKISGEVRILNEVPAYQFEGTLPADEQALKGEQLETCRQQQRRASRQGSAEALERKVSELTDQLQTCRRAQAQREAGGDEVAACRRNLASTSGELADLKRRYRAIEDANSGFSFSSSPPDVQKLFDLYRTYLEEKSGALQHILDIYRDGLVGCGDEQREDGEEARDAAGRDDRTESGTGSDHAEKARLADLIANLQTHISKFEADNEASRRLGDDQRGRRDSTSGERQAVAACPSRIADVAQACDEMALELRMDLAALGNELRDREDRVERLRSDVANLTTENQALRADVAKRDCENGAGAAALRAALDAIKQLETDLEARDRRLSDMAATMELQEDRLRRLDPETKN